MQNRWVARVFLGLIFAFPLLASALATPSLGTATALMKVLPAVGLVETFLIVGSFYATRQRRRLVADLEVARTQLAPSAPRTTPALHGSLVSLNKPLYSNLEH
ncbi:hypothetical protein [Singulisphaera sp. PoT]|uniref:hypothetical protein n=1 Tax=Singulisphaera sp. PoT TaxID=3411797 RepID=UPI003BF4A435